MVCLVGNNITSYIYTTFWITKQAPPNTQQEGRYWRKYENPQSIHDICIQVQVYICNMTHKGMQAVLPAYHKNDDITAWWCDMISLWCNMTHKWLKAVHLVYHNWWHHCLMVWYDVIMMQYDPLRTQGSAPGIS